MSSDRDAERPVDVSVVVLAFGEEPWLERCVRAILDSRGCRLETIVVDNECDPEAMAQIRMMADVRVLDPGRNLGFAAGCNYAAAEAEGDVLAFVNSDAVVHEGALARLAAVARRPDVGIASGSIRLASDPQLLNSAGGVVSYVGLSWPRGFGEPAHRFAVEREVTAASGAGMAIRRTLWEELGGFVPAYFAYKEDVELSWRCWQRGLSVVYVPDAVVLHHYEFSRNPRKLYLLERNRLLFVLSVFERRTLLLIAPMLLLVEAIMLVYAGVSGWGRLKIGGWVWLWRNRDVLRAERSQVQAMRRRSDAQLAPLLSSTFEPNNVDRPGGVGILNRLLRGYWFFVRRMLRAPAERPRTIGS